MADSQESIRRIQWSHSKTTPTITVCGSNGFLGKLTGKEAIAFTAVVNLGFAEAFRVQQEGDGGESGALEPETQQAAQDTPEPED